MAAECARAGHLVCPQAIRAAVVRGARHQWSRRAGKRRFGSLGSELAGAEL